MESIRSTGKRFGNQLSVSDSPREYSQRIQCDDVQRNREAAPEAGKIKTNHTCEDRQNQCTIPMATFAPRRQRVPNIQLIFRRTTLSDSKDSKCRNYHSKNSVIDHHSGCGKHYPKHRSPRVLNMLWIKEVEMVDSLDELVLAIRFMERIFQTSRC